MDFIDETTIVTAGRDCVVNVFGVEGAMRSTSLRIRKPRISRRAHTRKVRGVKVISGDQVRPIAVNIIMLLFGLIFILLTDGNDIGGLYGEDMGPGEF